MESTVKVEKITIFFLLLAFLQGCWTSENDIIEVTKLVGNFNIVYNKNDAPSGYILSLYTGSGLYRHIEKRCERVYFDSTEIFVEYTWHDADTTHHYSRIRILTNERVPFHKQELSSKEFHKLLELCKDCIEKKYDKISRSPL
ncbi:MAG: hypothetical protein BGO21_14030 [Dyadobacter sp. 50-39]|nr:MAG: hypothetical protein BGO21_14030 [Dyadobacter sp. 50-39]